MSNRWGNQPTSSVRTDATGYNEGLRQYMLGVYNYMTAALALTGLLAYAVGNIPGITQLFYYMTPEGSIEGVRGAYYLVLFAPVLLVFYMGARIMQMPLAQARGMFFFYAGLVGLSLGNLFLVYTGESLARVFLVTSASFAGLSLYGYSTKKDMTGFGSFLIMGVWGILIASIVNIWLKSPAIYFAVSAIGVFVFAGLTAYDTQKIRRMYFAAGGDPETAARVSILGALNLYLDFINLFVSLLRFMGDRR